MNKIFIILLIIFLNLFSFITLNASENIKIKIGLLVPLSGDNNEIGKQIVKATRLALKDINSDKIEIFPRDTRSDPNTTLKDIQWIKPKPKVKRQETVIKTFKSGSSDAMYTTKYYPTSGKYFCDCPGSWRSFGNCKHIKQMRNETLL